MQLRSTNLRARCVLAEVWAGEGCREIAEIPGMIRPQIELVNPSEIQSIVDEANLKCVLRSAGKDEKSCVIHVEPDVRATASAATEKARRNGN